MGFPPQVRILIVATPGSPLLPRGQWEPQPERRGGGWVHLGLCHLLCLCRDAEPGQLVLPGFSVDSRNEDLKNKISRAIIIGN